LFTKKRLFVQALTIIEYLIANGSERAVDDILDHYSKISVWIFFAFMILSILCHLLILNAIKYFLSCVVFVKVLSSFEYVEPNGKDAGINVRKKVETIVGIINDKERIKAVRDKAASNRDK